MDPRYKRGGGRTEQGKSRGGKRKRPRRERGREERIRRKGTGTGDMGILAPYLFRKFGTYGY
jgi:hypothetical protein